MQGHPVYQDSIIRARHLRHSAWENVSSDILRSLIRVFAGRMNMGSTERKAKPDLCEFAQADLSLRLAQISKVRSVTLRLILPGALPFHSKWRLTSIKIRIMALIRLRCCANFIVSHYVHLC